MQPYLFLHALPLVLLFLTVAPARAQVNIERLRKASEGLAFTFSADVAVQAGNNDVFEIGSSARVDYRSGKHYAFALGSVRYGEKGETTFRDAAFGHARYNVRFAEALVGEVFVQAARDEFTLLRLRLLAGVGPRLRYVDTERVGVFQGTALMLEHESLDGRTLEEHPAEITASRWSNYLNVRLALDEGLTFVNTVYLQPRLDAFGDVRVLDEAALSVALTDHLALTVGFELRYDSQPPDGIETLDLALRNGLALSF